MVASFSKRLASLEVSGASPQELVTNMKLVATLYHKAGASDNARQLLVSYETLVQQCTSNLFIFMLIYCMYIYATLYT